MKHEKQFKSQLSHDRNFVRNIDKYINTWTVLLTRYYH